MNLRPLVLGVSLLAASASVAAAQQAGPPLGDTDLGLSPAQLADFADQPHALGGAAWGPVDYSPGQPASVGQPVLPVGGQIDFAAHQAIQMGYLAPQAAAPSPQTGPPANSQQMLTPSPAEIPPNWPNANMPQPMMQGNLGPYGYGGYGPGCGPNCGPPGPDATPGPGPGVPPYEGCPNGLSGNCNPPRPCWYLRGDSVWLTRSRPDNHNLTSYENLNDPKDPFNSHILLSTDDVTYPLEPGMRITFGRYITDTWMVEGTYYGAVNWDRRNGTATFPTGANGLGPLFPYWGPTLAGAAFDTSAFTGSNEQIASYESQFNSFELNVRHAIWGTTTVMGGFRYMNIGDLFQLSAFDEGSKTSPSGFYRTWTNNNLVGFQLGTEYSHDLWCPRLFVSIDCRGGLYANAAEQKNLLFNSGDTYNQRSSRESQFASAWDLTLALSYLATDHLTIRGGYTFMYINGIALAPNQLDTNPTTQSSRNGLADNDSLTLQGPFLGGELAW